MKCIINGKIITENAVLDNNVIVFSDKIENILPQAKTDLKGFEIIDAKGNYVCPGFISTHIHGCLGYDVSDGSIEAVEAISKHLLSTGVTSWCPTLCTVDLPIFHKVLDSVRKVKERSLYADIIGLYLEGIFLSKEKKGAHREEWLKLPDKKLIIDNKDIIKLCICAPELYGAEDFIKALTNEGIKVSVGHSNATYEQTVTAINAGATNTSHLFNACSAFSHRDIALPGAVLSDDRIYTELICDNFHVSSVLYDIVYKLKGDKLIFITDSINPCGMPDGEYDFAGLKVIKRGNECRLENGVIAGSVIDLNKGISNVIKNSNIPLNEIIKAVSLNPAKMLNVDKKIGSLKKGKNADIVIADKDFNIIKVIKSGN